MTASGAWADELGFGAPSAQSLRQIGMFGSLPSPFPMKRTAATPATRFRRGAWLRYPVRRRQQQNFRREVYD